MHPRGLPSPRIDKAKYESMRAAIITLLKETGEIEFKVAMEMVYERHKSTFEGAIPWYYTIVKLDMEARGELIRVSGKGNQRIKLP